MFRQADLFKCFAFLTSSLLIVGCGGNNTTSQDEDMASGGFVIEEDASMTANMDMSQLPDRGMGGEDLGSMADLGGGGEDAGGVGLDMAMDAGEVDLGMDPADMGGDLSGDMGGGVEDMSLPPADMGPINYPPVTDMDLAGMGRPAKVFVPQTFDNTRSVPLVVALHGYGGDRDNVPNYFSLARNVDDKDFVLIAPDGNKDLLGSQFWNATDACCDGFNNNPDDHGYIRGLIQEAKQRFNIDAGQVYVVGYSNGGFMSYRMACDSADLVTGIFTLAGATYKNAMDCNPSQPVAVFQLHGTADQTIKYNGGNAYPGGAQHPGAVETVEHWAAYNGCDPGIMMLDNSEVNAVTVEETTVQGFNNCPALAPVELWTLDGAPHNPGMPRTFGPMLLDRLFALDRTP